MSLSIFGQPHGPLTRRNDDNGVPSARADSGRGTGVKAVFAADGEGRYDLHPRTGDHVMLSRAAGAKTIIVFAIDLTSLIHSECSPFSGAHDVISYR